MGGVLAVGVVFQGQLCKPGKAGAAQFLQHHESSFDHAGGMACGVELAIHHGSAFKHRFCAVFCQHGSAMIIRCCGFTLQHIRLGKGNNTAAGCHNVRNTGALICQEGMKCRIILSSLGNIGNDEHVQRRAVLKVGIGHKGHAMLAGYRCFGRRDD